MLWTVLGTGDTGLSQSRFWCQRNSSVRERQVSSKDFGGLATVWGGRLSTGISLPAASRRCLQFETLGSYEPSRKAFARDRESVLPGTAWGWKGYAVRKVH